MTDDEVIEHIEVLRQTTTDTANVEAKRSEKALPKSIRNTLSSFSNTPGGGVVEDEKAFGCHALGDRLRRDPKPLRRLLTPMVAMRPRAL
jgi:hypothetical protein